MGDKITSKKIAQEAGVNTVPGYMGEIKDENEALSISEKIGYPVMIKASAGGGGKGMRIAWNDSEVKEGFQSSKNEAASSFGDDRIFIEKFVTQPRHIEIQVLADTKGNCIYLGERECSIQRRNQKVVEEAPSSFLDEKTRRKMGEQACNLAKAVGYSSAGTVEFIVDKDKNFYFLEMNTRLQVEHPVTEEITGLDLVREQILIAQGMPLSVSQEDLSINGHAMEVRIYGEDPANDFLPTAGPVLLFERSKVADARYDTGIETGSNVGIEFDPMLAKIIVHAPTRTEASLRLARVLETTRIQGLITNRDFLVSVLREQAFLDGDTTTDYIERINPPRSRAVDRGQIIEGAIAAAMAAQYDRRLASNTLKRIRSGWRNSIMPPEHVEYTCGEEEVTIDYQSQRDGSFNVMADDLTLKVELVERDGNTIDMTVDGRRVAYTVTSNEDRWLTHGPSGQLEYTELPRFPDLTRAGLKGGLTAPMPGNVVDTYVKEGDEVEEGQLLLILEGMKMEHRITAPDAGTIGELRVGKGDQVQNGQLMVVLQAEEETA